MADFIIKHTSRCRQKKTGYGNFANARARIVVVILLFIHATLIYINLFLGTDFYFTLINILMFSLSVFLFCNIKSVSIYFLISHPTWLFSFNTYVFSILLGHSVSANLSAPNTSILLALLYQLACIAAALTAKPFLHFIMPKEHTQSLQHNGNIERWLSIIKYPFIIIGCMGIILNFNSSFDAGVSGSHISAIASFCRSFLWLGLSVHVYQRKGIFPLDLIIAIPLLFYMFEGIFQNARTPILEVLLFVILADMLFSKKFITVSKIVILFFTLSAVSVFSDATLDIRGEVRTSGNIIEGYARELLRGEALEKFVMPWRDDTQPDYNKFKSDAYDTRLSYYDGGSSLAGRFVLLPMLDVVVPFQSFSKPVDWSTVKGIALSVLPNFGQEKILQYGDSVVWASGLRSPGVVGRPNIGYPMITQVGEYYAMGGASFSFIALYIIFTIILVDITIIARILKSPEIVILTLSNWLIFSIVSTSALSFLSVALRGLPMQIVLLFLARWVLTKCERPRGR
jgi:hypothetical protein